MRLTLILVAFSFVFLLSCNESGHKKTITDADAEKDSPLQSNEDVLAMAQGFKLLENSCYSCHSADASVQPSIAPTIADIKEHYTHGNISLEEFKNDMISFILEPSVESSKMPEAIEKYGLMPKMNVSKEEISNIAYYMYHTELEEPHWYENQFQNEKLKYDSLSLAAKNPVDEFKSLAMKTKSVIGKNLLNAINTGGTEYALSFCSERAIFLTDSMAQSLHANIKRVSDKNRNPNNVANASELAYIRSSKESLMNGETVKPKLITVDGNQMAYIPIFTNDMCLQCHGKPEKDITKQTLAKINQLYPDDKAQEYKSGQLRGIWVIDQAEE